MGTKRGNLHILGASVEEVAPFLPGAVVGQWSQRFVSAYSEDYQWGTAEWAGKKLSRKLPEATILSAAIFDSDVVSFGVFQAGKQLTRHLSGFDNGRNKVGNPKGFCEALGLPSEDENRLKVVWKKGDAEEQMALTAALLGAPLCFDPEFLPKEPVHRDTALVDTWIADHPDPPKVKSVTKAVLVQEIPDAIKPTPVGDNFFALSSVSGMEEEKETFGVHVHTYVWYLISHDCLYHFDEDGTLQLVVKRERHPDQPESRFCADAGPASDVPRTEFRSAGENRVVELRITNDRCSWEVTWDSEGRAVGRKGNDLVSEYRFSDWQAPVLTPDSKTLFFAKWGEGLQLIDAKTGEIRRELKSTAHILSYCADGFGRFWIKVGDKTVEGYDENLRLISHHRLKEDIFALRVNAKGELMAYTYDFIYQSDDRTFRVYRIS